MCEQQNTINFVMEVEKHPCLYNTTLSSYSRKVDTFKAWEEVGKVMNMTGAACKEKWRNLRVVFLRHFRPRSGKKQSRPYYLLDVMQFITPFIRPVTLSTNSTEEKENLTDNEDDTNLSNELLQHESEPISVNYEQLDNQPSSPKKKKTPQQETEERYWLSPENHKKYVEFLKRKHRDESLVPRDIVASFLNSLTPELTEMNMQQFNIFKRKVLTLVDDIMCQSAANTSSVYQQSMLSLNTQCASPSSNDALDNSNSATSFHQDQDVKTEFERYGKSN